MNVWCGSIHVAPVWHLCIGGGVHIQSTPEVINQVNLLNFAEGRHHGRD